MALRKAMRPRMAIRLAATDATTLIACMAPFEAASTTLRAGLQDTITHRKYHTGHKIL